MSPFLRRPHSQQHRPIPARLMALVRFVILCQFSSILLIFSSVQDDVLVDIGAPRYHGDARSIRSSTSMRKTGVWEDLKAWTNNVLFGKTANLSKSSEEEHRIASKLREIAALDKDEILKRFNTGYNGLSASDSTTRLAKFGRNELETGALKSWYSIIFQGLIHPFNVLLMILGILAISVAEDPTTFYFVLVMVVVSVGLRSYEGVFLFYLYI